MLFSQDKNTQNDFYFLQKDSTYSVYKNYTKIQEKREVWLLFSIFSHIKFLLQTSQMLLNLLNHKLQVLFNIVFSLDLKSCCIFVSSSTKTSR